MSDSEQCPPFNSPRLVLKKVLAQSQQEGDGALVTRGIGSIELQSLDPFLLLDHFSVSPPAGFPDHPHRGFETVTYMLQGGITHQDFAGHRGTIRTGDVQWMTAGRGIIHSEMPAGEGTHKGIQLWINLPATHKMIEPNYQELASEDIASAEKDGVRVRVIAGEAMGVHSRVYTRTPTMFLDFTLEPGAELHQGIPETWNSFVYVIDGEGVFGFPSCSPIMRHHVLVLSLGDGLSVWNKSEQALRFVLIGGQPLNEPVARHGPFVMNTQSEIKKTIQDYHFRKNGFEMGKYWTSQY
ncbi:pirin-like protein [Gastrolobium bilobum]|uniref:pirin-like protein n=1 Tax=Gastrolobium bilobum TaxID=150636 RepID=UPI002AAF702C|nr:pirin-like protein [Gastrolobium bilobum]